MKFALILLLCCGGLTTVNSLASQSDNKYVKLSQDFLKDLKDGGDGKKYVKQLAEIDFDELVDSVKTKNEKLAFWMNIYNALVQYQLTDNPDIYKDRGEFFKKKWHNIAGIEMSYDDIEHGIIRNSRMKLSLGYLKKFCNPKWERKLRNKKIDGRVHFALNCGAKSCPPVAIYDDSRLDTQLDKSARMYLQQVSEVVDTLDKGSPIVKTSPLFSWFRADFGGKRGIRKMLRKFEVITKEEKHDLQYQPYDWTLMTGNYIEL